MRNSVKICGIAAALACLAVANGASAADPKYVLPAAARAVEDGRLVEVIVPQQEIKSDINPSNVTVAMGGGLLGALIDAKIQADRAKKAELEIEPVRTALTGFDADKLAQDTTAAALGKVPWLKVQSTSFGRDDTVVRLSETLDTSPTENVLFVKYSYDLSPDFSSVRVAARLILASKSLAGVKAPTNRLDTKNLTYVQTVQSIVMLPAVSKDSSENASRWAAGNGTLARSALTIAFADLSTMIPRALELSAEDVKAMNSRDHKITAIGGRTGRLVEQNAGGSLLFSGDLAHLQTMAQ